jgi:hypothetical protein
MLRRGFLSIISRISEIRTELRSVLIPLENSQQNLCDICLLPCVQCYTPVDGQRNCPKHVEFNSKNKLEKLVHFVGFIVRIYHDARSSECQNRTPAGYEDFVEMTLRF